jgi:hypothetical protein
MNLIEVMLKKVNQIDKLSNIYFRIFTVNNLLYKMNKLFLLDIIYTA